MIKSEIVDGIAVLTLAHGKANALDIELCDALARHFAELRRSDLRAVVLTGQGKIFSAGVDLKRLSTGGADYIRRFLPALHRLYEAVFFHPKPVVAAINGHCRRLRAGLLRRSPDHGARERPHRCDRNTCRRAIPGTRV